MRYLVLGAVLLACPAPAWAARIFIDFDQVTRGASVENFYNGGSDSTGASGPNLQVRFTNFVTTTGFGEVSLPYLAYNTDALATINSGLGFGRVEVAYGAFSTGTLRAFALPDGGGAELASYSLLTNNPYAFSQIAFQFAGTAHSLTLTGGTAQLGIDNLVLTDAIMSPMPEPSTWLTALFGFALTGAAMRRRRVVFRGS